MKKLGLWLFIVFIFAASIYALLQSDFVRNITRHLLTDALQKSGFEVQIDQIRGTLPHQIDLKGISIQGKGVDVKIEQLSLRPILWRLMKKEVAFTHIHAHHISLNQGTAFDFAGKFRMNKKYAFLQGKVDDWTLLARFNRIKYLVNFKLFNPLLQAKGQGQLDKTYQLASAKIQLTSDQLLSKLPFPARGRLLSNIILTREANTIQARAHWQIPNWKMKGNAQATIEGRQMRGELSAPLVKATFDLTLRPDGLIVGTNQIAIENLQSLPSPDLYGKLTANAEWHPLNGVQGLHLDATVTDFYYGPYFAQTLSVYSDLQDPFHEIKGLFDIEVEKGKWHDMQIETASLETTSGEENWPFRLFAEGKWKHPLEIRINGHWKDHFIADIQNLDGTFFNHPFALTQPIQLAWTQDAFRLSDTEITVGNATAFVYVDRQKGRTDARLRFNQMPLDFFSLNPLDVSIAGTLTLEADVHEENNQLKGDLKASLAQNEPFHAIGAFEGHFDRDLLHLAGNLNVHNTPLLNLDVAVPIHFSLWPFQADLLVHKSASGHIALKGHIEEFLDFIDFGPHRLEGECHCDLKFTNTLSSPLVNGYLHFENGFYENYYTGTTLHNIQADLVAEKNIVYLRSFTAQDQSNTGHLTATGQIRLLPSDLYPFHLDATLDNLRFIEIDLVSSSANGKVRIEGNSTSAIAKGDIHILQSALTIPDHIPRPLPNLQVVYRNALHPVPPPEKEYQPYPLYLDLHVIAPEGIAISGRGLSSEWKGDFHLGGTYTALAAKGALELIDGEFNFSSRSFKLTEGSLSLSGVEKEMPSLNLAGSMETKGITITARLKGPLNNPQITLQSTPPLPLSSIVSYLLFGQDLSEISGFQALQLATSLASLAGTGPDIMESARRSLGVDRLRVIADPTEEGGETVALQVGKYISKGVLVSFTQGTDDSSTNVSVEIELRGNFVFQIQSDQRQEQGVFTLKWNLNY